MVIISGSSLFKPCKAFCHPWVWEFIYWINPVEKKRKVKTSKLITHFMVLEFILLLKNNNFKYIQSWKKTNLLHLCVKQIWWLLTYVCNARKWNSSATQHWVTLHCKAEPALDSPPLQRRGWGGEGTNKHSLKNQQAKGATCSLQSWSKTMMSSEDFLPFLFTKQRR